MAKFEKDPLLGTRIREYQILESIGRGGMGAVYRARHIYLDKERAIKVVHRSLTESQDFVQRFIREAKVLSELNHPNVVQLYDFGMLDDNTFFMVMELIQGETVIERIQKQTRLSPEDSVRIVREAALGLSSAHRKGIIHRDISPDNLILVHNEFKNEITKVVDFGIAKPLHEDTGRFTMTNFFIGKPEYSSPEQCGTLKDDETLDQRSDIYSLGVTFFQMLTGRLPFVASTPQGYLLKHAHETPKPPSSYLPHGEIPRALDSLVMKMLTKRREDRHRNLEKVIEEIDSISFTEGPTLASLEKQAQMAEQYEPLIDQTLRADRESIFPPFKITTQEVEEVNAPTEPLPQQNASSSQQYTSTTPIRAASQRKSNQAALIGLLVVLFVSIFGAGGFFLYRLWNERNSESAEGAGNGIIVSAEEALQSGDDKRAEELLKEAEAQKVSGQEERLNRIRNGIAEIRKQGMMDAAAEHLRKAKELIAGGKLDEASAELAAVQSLNLPEFQNEIDSTKSVIEERQKKSASLKEANQLLKEIDAALASGNLELSEQKLKAFRSRKFQGFENDIATLETMISNARKQLNLKKGSQLLDEAEKLLAQQKFETASQRVEQAQLLKIPDLEPRIRSISARLSSLQKQNEESFQKAQSLINSARVLIQMGEIGQAQQWLSQARSLGVPELQSEIDSLTRQAKNSNPRAAAGRGLDAVESALKRGDWIDAQRALKAVQANPPEDSAARIEELNQQIQALRPYLGFGVRQKWGDVEKKKYGVEFGTVVVKVDQGSPGERSGLRAGDVIIEYNGSVLVNDSQLAWLGAYSKPGSEVLLKIIRNGERLNIRIRVESMNSAQRR